jgi:hypothetical protein
MLNIVLVCPTIKDQYRLMENESIERFASPSANVYLHSVLADQLLIIISQNYIYSHFLLFVTFLKLIFFPLPSSTCLSLFSHIFLPLSLPYCMPEWINNKLVDGVGEKKM